MAGFSEPTYDEVATAQVSDPAQSIDLNDPLITSEPLDINPEADAYASPPPPPDGWYRVKLKQIDVKDQNGNPTRIKAGKAKDGQVYLNTALEARILDPTGKYDNIPIYDRWVGTFKNRDGSTKVTTILFKLGVAIPRGGTHKDLMDLFIKTLAGEPEIEIETAWEAGCQKCQEEHKANPGGVKPKDVKGMNRFPRDNSGAAIPELPCPVDKAHGVMVAQARIVGFRAIKK